MMIKGIQSVKIIEPNQETSQSPKRSVSSESVDESSSIEHITKKIHTNLKPAPLVDDGFGWVWQETQRKSSKKQPPAQPAPSTNAPDQSNMPVAPWDTMGLNKVTTPYSPSNLWADWISKNEDWYLQNVGKLFPSYNELMDIELYGYIPFLSALEAGSEPVSQSCHPQLTLKGDDYTPYPFTLPAYSIVGDAWQD